MADRGELYPVFDMDFVQEMKKLVGEGDIVLPNITEASLLTDTEYREEYDEEYICGLVDGIHRLGAGTVVLTGVSYDAQSTGVLVSEQGKQTYYRHELLDRGCHGTGDVYASSFVGAYMHGKTVPEAARIAADYTLACIKNTLDDPDHWYGVKFEPVLGELIEALK